MQNSQEDIYLSNGDTLYLITGLSPNGLSFKTNKCSGYLQEFQTYVPYINLSCPRAVDEDRSTIPRYTSDDACLDYIDSYPICKTQIETLPATWSVECKNFISKTMNYSSCINIHKNDKDFYKPEWRVYLRRNESMWKNQRENIVLYDDLGKIVDSLQY